MRREDGPVEVWASIVEKPFANPQPDSLQSKPRRSEYFSGLGLFVPAITLPSEKWRCTHESKPPELGVFHRRNIGRPACCNPADSARTWKRTRDQGSNP